MRLKSVKNIEKITKSMKMVSAAKYSQAERELKPARTYGRGALCKCSSCILAVSMSVVASGVGRPGYEAVVFSGSLPLS